MSHNSLRRFIVLFTEISAVIGALVTSVLAGPSPTAMAATDAPTIAVTVSAPAGVTIDSPWVTDATGNTAWALGVTTSGTGVLARRDLATATITTTPTVTGEIGATEGRLIVPTGNIAFLAKRQGAGGRLVVINPNTGVRVSSYDLTAADTNPRGLGWNGTGSSLFVGSNTATSQAQRVTTATGAGAGTVAFPSTPIVSGIQYGTKVAFITGAPTTKLIMVKDGTTAMIESTTSLPTITHNVADPLTIGSTVWLGTDSTPGRLVSIDLSSRAVLTNVALPADHGGLRNLTAAPGGTALYGTTVTAGHTRLVTIRMSDGAELGNVDLGPIVGATSVSVTGRYVDVTFSGATSLVRLTTAASPTSPTGLRAIEADESVDVEWTASISEEPLVTYTVTAESESESQSCRTTATSCTLTGLTNGVSYSLSVIASSYAGSSASTTTTASPATSPAEPMNVSAVRGNGSIEVTWGRPDDGGRPLLDYTVTVEPGGTTCVTLTESCLIAGLPNGQEFTATVVARTVWGQSAPSLPSAAVRTATTPGEPTNVLARRGDRLVELTWDAPLDDGGEPVTTYSVLRDGEVLCQTVALTCLIQDLINGVPVSFVVVASNAVGSSNWSSPSDPAIPAAVPEVPGNVSVTPATDGATLSWTEPSNGGEPITRYRIAVWNETQRVTEIDVQDTTARIENLVYPTVYRFTIEAVNAVGTSAQVAVFSAPLAPPPPPVVEPPVVEPPVNPEPPTPPSTTAPSSPRTLTLRSVSRSFYTLTWLEPHNGGSPITDYRIAKRVSSRGVFTAVNDGVNNRRSVRIPRPSNGTAIYVRVVSVNSTGESTTPTVVMLKGKKIYAIPSVVAVRLSDAAAFAGLDARSTPYDGTSVARGFAHWSFL